MPRIAIPKREDAPVESELILDNIDKMLGFVPHLHRLMSIACEDAGRQDERRDRAGGV